ncbi:hypothetical protein AMATHDRAFT_140574 [Amanita thiersii Skay4041]|uniref:F-box domain-containing protein n=1 Tax=Amanita thiersii Skay4041 TaxID=703135 RepID=A0A2A9NWL2_9AGAR|nr:hypothetical protein AMATHDRAFT_140574 [Amanita thiersii Skay4041]
MSSIILNLPAEVILHIFSYLDLPDLVSIARALPVLNSLTGDPILHAQRLNIVAPARLKHFLFSTNIHGVPLRPTIGDLVHRGVIRGLNVEHRWRMGEYIYTVNSIKQYEMGVQLARKHASVVVSRQLTRRLSAAPNQVLQGLHHSHVLPDVESSSPSISRNLLPIMHKLKWSLQRDRIARIISARFYIVSTTKGIDEWLQGNGKRVMHDNERLRLAVCPNIRKIIEFYEGLSTI